jgi:hypothetical protein
MTDITADSPQFKRIRAGGKPGRTDPRGNSYNRRAAKRWLLSPEAGYGGTGSSVNCVHCGTMLTFGTLERDRKKPGGPYARHNLQPACRTCNLSRSNDATWKGPLSK